MILIKENNINGRFLYIPLKLIIIIAFVMPLFKIKTIIFIDIDNDIGFYENNIDFSNYSSDIKTIALFYPQIHEIKEKDKIWRQSFTDWKNIKKAKPLYKKHHQPRIPGDANEYLGYYETTTLEILKKQIKLAKIHGIFGFAFYYFWFSGKSFLEKALDILLNNKDIDFHFLLIWNNLNWTKNSERDELKVLSCKDYQKNDIENFIKNIKKYLVDTRYININGKPIIGIYEPMKIPNIKETIMILRKKSKENDIGDIYIIASLIDGNLEEYQNMKLFNGVYQFSPRDSMNLTLIKLQSNLYLYTAALYNEFNLSSINLNNFQFYRGSMVEFDDTPNKVKDYAIFKNYSPEQFYRICKKIVEWTENKYNMTNRFIFINAWNNWGEGTYLEPDEKYGYASINALSKAIFHLPYYTNNYNLTYLLTKECKIAVQVHVYYEDLINEIINVTNNIPIQYDLYISTTSMTKANNIEEYIKNKSLARNYEIKIYENKGRDVFPFLLQLKEKYKKYKYVCHLHTKKTTFMSFGDEWRQYLYNNLLGNKAIISEILTDFENNDKIGFIFPEAFHKVIIQYGIELTEKDKYYMDFLLKKLYKNSYRIGSQLEFPEGDMFWAKIDSIYQIFTLNLSNDIPQENKQVDGTIMHGIERIWLYLVKLNGYSYKKIFKSL